MGASTMRANWASTPGEGKLTIGGQLPPTGWVRSKRNVQGSLPRILRGDVGSSLPFHDGTKARDAGEGRDCSVGSVAGE